MINSRPLENFRKEIADKYTIYNSLFAALPFSGVANAGALLPILLQACKEGFAAQKEPAEILDQFFEQHTGAQSWKEKTGSMFKFIQYIERQVVLFDAIEDAGFTAVHDVEGQGSLKRLLTDVAFAGKKEELKKKLEHFKVRVVLTAHPTQFYPGTVLGIIHDMAGAIHKNDFHTINGYIQQLGITPFFNKKQPTPYDEAINQMWYLENILYHSAGKIYDFINKEIFDSAYGGNNPFVELGFWPGGDRDGNPFVDAATTLKVAKALHSSIITCYYRDVRKLSRRLTFTGVDKMLNNLQQLLYENIFNLSNPSFITTSFLLEVLYEIRQLVLHRHHSLFLPLLDSLIHKVKIFGTHFATLDIRQNSKVHADVMAEIVALQQQNLKLPEGKDYHSLTDEQKLSLLPHLEPIAPSQLPEGIVRDTIQTVQAIKQIQEVNGEAGCHRYIISNCTSAVNVMEVYALCKVAGWQQDEMNIDIIPLFETIDDLAAAESVMNWLYSDPLYQTHLVKRNKQQTVMVGFSDGTKDGGYLQANWSIYKAKETITSVSRRHGIKVKFFDGRGGPPSRGGGKSHRFYASLGNAIENDEIQLTIQGQTITSNFGTIQSSQYNLEQLMSAGITNELFPDKSGHLSEEDRALLDELSEAGFKFYSQLKNHSLFMEYLQLLSPLNYYSKTNIASRPSKRGGDSKMNFADLRAIPFVGSWSQIKQNVPGFYGVGAALKQAKENGHWPALQRMYNEVLFFKTLVDNSMMSMLKSFFSLTRHYAHHATLGVIWKMIHDEYEQTVQLLLELSGTSQLLEEDQASRASILMRDQIVLPLLAIQQYALQKINEAPGDSEQKTVYENLVTRSMFGIINAGRNSA